MDKNIHLEIAKRLQLNSEKGITIASVSFYSSNTGIQIDSSIDHEFLTVSITKKALKELFLQIRNDIDKNREDYEPDSAYFA